MPRSISSPPTKRIKLSQPTNSLATISPSSPPPPAPHPNTLRIISWNINGITPFLQNSITKYFSQTRPQQQQQQQKDAGSKESQTRRQANLRAFLQRHHWPAILFLQEIKIAATDTKTQNAVQNAVNTVVPIEQSTSNNRGPTYDVHFTLPTDRHNSRGLGGTGKVYGVCTMIRSNLSQTFSLKPPEVRTVDWDKEGRVSVVLLTPSPSISSKPSSQSSSVAPTLPLALLNIYAVNGTDSPYRNPLTGAINGTRHDRKLAFHKLLMRECVSLQEEGYYVLLAGDFNIAPARIDGHPNLRTWPEQHVINRRDFWEKFVLVEQEEEKESGSRGDNAVKTNEAGKETKPKHVETSRPEPQPAPKTHPPSFPTIDIFRALNPTARRYTYFPRSRDWGTSCDRVDYMLVARKLWETGRISACGIMDCPQERGPSDHVPVWVDIDMGFGEESDA